MVEIWTRLVFWRVEFLTFLVFDVYLREAMTSNMAHKIISQQMEEYARCIRFIVPVVQTRELIENLQPRHPIGFSPVYFVCIEKEMCEIGDGRLGSVETSRV